MFRDVKKKSESQISAVFGKEEEKIQLLPPTSSFRLKKKSRQKNKLSYEMT